MMANKAENKPENRMIQSILRRRIAPLRFFFLDLKSNHRSAAMEARYDRRKARVPLMSARVFQNSGETMHLMMVDRSNIESRNFSFFSLFYLGRIRALPWDRSDLREEERNKPKPGEK